MPRLRGPKTPTVAFVPPDLGLSKAKREEVEIRVRHLLNRWTPLTEDPNNLAREVYELGAWLMNEADDPDCPLLTVD